MLIIQNNQVSIKWNQSNNLPKYGLIVIRRVTMSDGEQQGINLIMRASRRPARPDVIRPTTLLQRTPLALDLLHACHRAHTQAQHSSALHFRENPGNLCNISCALHVVQMLHMCAYNGQQVVRSIFGSTEGLSVYCTD